MQPVADNMAAIHACTRTREKCMGTEESDELSTERDTIIATNPSLINCGAVYMYVDMPISGQASQANWNMFGQLVRIHVRHFLNKELN